MPKATDQLPNATDQVAHPPAPPLGCRRRCVRMLKSVVAVAAAAAVLGLSQSSVPAPAPVRPAPPAEWSGTQAAARPAAPDPSPAPAPAAHARTAQPLTVLTRGGSWFVYPQGCETVRARRDVVLHFHGAHTTVIPRYLATALDAVLVIVNKGIGSGPYSRALALRSQVDGLLERVENRIERQCDLPDASITRLALSSWSAGYGAVQQFLRLRPERVSAVLLADGLHVGFADRKARIADVAQLDVFAAFARRAARGERLMAITHSAIEPETYAGAAETAWALSQAVHAPTWRVVAENHGMPQLSAARRRYFYVEGFDGNDEAAHAQHLYSIGSTLFTRLREYWQK